MTALRQGRQQGGSEGSHAPPPPLAILFGVPDERSFTLIKIV